MLTLAKFVGMRIQVYEILNGREPMTLIEIGATMGIITEEDLRNLEQVLDGLVSEKSNKVYKCLDRSGEVCYCVI